MDPYQILGLKSGASRAEIEKAYKNLSIKNHPDKFRDEASKKQAEKRFKEVGEAYNLLKKGNFRWSPGFQGHGFQGDSSSMEDLLRSFFGGGFESQGFSSGGFGFENIFRQSYQTSINLSVVETLREREMEINVKNQRIKFNLPQGVKNGTTLEIDRPKFRLSVKVRVMNGRDGYFRVSDDLIQIHGLTTDEKEKGFFSLNHPLKGSETIKVPSNLGFGQEVRMSNLGFGSPLKHSKGDWVIILDTENNSRSRRILNDFLLYNAT